MNKKTIRLDFRYFWKGFEKDNNFFIDFLKQYYNVILDEKNPDYVIFSVFETSELCKSKKFFERILRRGYLSVRFKLKKKIYNFLRKPIPQPFRVPKIKGNFVKIFYTAENVKPKMNLCDWAFSFYYDEEFKHPRHLRLPIYLFEGQENKLIKKKMNIKKQIKRRTNFCNFIYSNNISFRNEFLKKLSKYKIVDSPGKCMNNMKRIPIINNSRNPFEMKIDFLRNYKFTIAFENSITPGYTTEKLTHPMMANSIPIYFGNPFVTRDFNVKSFVNVNNFKSFDEAIKEVIKIDNNTELYEEMLKEPWFKNNKPNKYVNKKILKKRFEEIFKKTNNP